MHEFALCELLLRQVETLQKEQNADRVTGVRVKVGEFSGVEPELLQQAGDYVIVHVGFAIQRMDEDEALKTLAALDELAEAHRPPQP